MGPNGDPRRRTQTGDLARVLRDYALEPRRRELGAEGGCGLVIEDARGARRLSAGEACDAIWIQLESLDGIDLGEVARGVARRLRPAGSLVCVVPGAWPLGLVLERALLGRGVAPGALRVRLDGAPERRATFSAWRRAFEPTIAWRRSRALGLFIPASAVGERLPPLAVGLLAMAEAVVAGWPLVRGLGEWVVHEGVRR